MNILLYLSFNGEAYHGFQVQENALSVCEVLQNAMQKVFGARPDVKGCSRTDTGVHARRYALSFKLETDIPLWKLPLALNYYLPVDIRVCSAHAVNEDFHARYSAKSKEYQYVFLNSNVDDPFCSGQYYRVSLLINETLMQNAANCLIGKHDFSAFMSSGSDVEDTVRTVTKLEVIRNENRVIITIAADGFLYNMVRIIAGTLLKAGRGKISPEEMQSILKSKNRAKAGEKMHAKGLFLNKVFYD